MDEDEARNIRFDGTVAVFFACHYQVDPRDWTNIEEFNGPHHPLLGYYKSNDRTVLRQQLHWMRRAGIDAIVYNAYGTVKMDPIDLPKDRALALLVDELEHQQEEDRNLQLVIYVEKYIGNPTVGEYRIALDYVRDHLAEKDFYYHYEGRPLVVTYHNGRNDAIDEIEWENDYFTLRRVRPYYSDVWCYVDHFPQRLSRKWMVASPGFDPYLEHAYMAKYVRKRDDLDLYKIYQESRKGAAHREEGAHFTKQLLRARYGNPDIIFISGWNDWQYANQIEPAVEYGFQYVDMAARLLGREAETAPYRD
jgi:hypothetical protein